jgi:hypothetical protein
VLRIGDKIVALNGERLRGPIVTALDPNRKVQVVTVHRAVRGEAAVHAQAQEKHPPARFRSSGVPEGMPPPR